MRSKEHKLPIKGFLETSFVDWNGYISSVIFLGGCNFRCPYCHNRDLVLFSDKIEDVPVRYIMQSLKKYRMWIDRVVITGGEPTIHIGLAELLRMLKREGLKLKLDTNGSFPERVKFLIREGLVDFISMDIKGPIDKYEMWCGVRVEKDRILDTIRFLQSSGVGYEFRMTVVPSLHTEEDVCETARLVKGSGNLTIQGFRPINTLDPTFMEITPYSKDELEGIKKKVKEILNG